MASRFAPAWQLLAAERALAALAAAPVVALGAPPCRSRVRPLNGTVALRDRISPRRGAYPAKRS